MRARLAIAFLLLWAAMCGARAAAAQDFTLVAGGDLLGPFHALPAASDASLRPLAAIFAGADLGFANQEGSIFDLKDFAGFPAAENGGGYPLQPRAAAAFFRSLGINAVSKANNHATDWGSEGLAATLASLQAVGIAQAGAGAGIAAARGATYVATPHGTAALVAAASTFPPMSLPGDPVTRNGVASHARPGISVLHVHRVHLVTAADLDRLATGSGDAVVDGTVRIGDEIYRAAAARGETWEMDPADVSAILGAIGTARPRSRFVLFSLHAHETGGDDDPMRPGPFEPMLLHRANEAPSPDDPTPAAFVVAIAHQAIDAGADAVVRTGPHVVNGIEIYHGRPIFYGLGSLFFDFGVHYSYHAAGGAVYHFPSGWFETIVPVCRFAGDRLVSIDIHPMTMGAAPGGAPVPATGDAARAILAHLAEISQTYGTRMTIEGDIGRIRAD